MNNSFKVGFCFGATSGIITTLGIIIGMYARTKSKTMVIGSILIIAVADAFSDALGIHISEESENKHTSKEIWISTFATFISKFIFALTFIIPVLLFNLASAVICSIIWGILVLVIISYNIAREQKIVAWKVIAEHLLIALLVISSTYYLGYIIELKFG
ncbi:MAG: hypothetical protein DRP78_03205 [Candidatus Omnitrophota bacterium]|nr:MAG: hypothetical protein DRP78_03205 [Candidatus Omnitrophota bacterium]